MALRIFRRIADAVSGPDPTGRRLEERWVVAKKRLLDTDPRQHEREHDNALSEVTELFGELLSRNVGHLLQLSRNYSGLELHYLLKEHSGYDHPRYSVPYGTEINIEQYKSDSLLLAAIVSIHGGSLSGFGTVGENPHFSARVFEHLSSSRDEPRAYFFKGIMCKYGPMPQSAPDLVLAETSLQLALGKGVTSAAIELENMGLHNVLRNYTPAYYKVDSWDSWAEG